MRVSNRLVAVAALVAAALVAAPVSADSKPKKPKKPRPAHPAHPARPARPTPPPPPPCTGDPTSVQRLDLTVGGQPAWGLYAYPTRPPRGLVVFAHGYGHTAESWRRHVSETASRLGVVAVAMNYRGQTDYAPAPGQSLPTSRGWQVQEGAEDSIAAALHFDGKCPSLAQTVMYGVSMGGNTAGLAVAAKATRRGGRPLFDWLVDVEGATNVTETYLGARALAGSGNSFARNAQADIEWQMGGPIETHRDQYLRRTVVNRIGDIATSGVRGVVVVHGVADGLVPYNQSREFVELLREAGVPTDMFTVVTRGTSEPGTTLDGYVTGNVPGFVSPTSGHGSETSETHLVVRTGLDRLAELFTEGAPTCAEYLVDGTLGVVAPRRLATDPAC